MPWPKYSCPFYTTGDRLKTATPPDDPISWFVSAKPNLFLFCHNWQCVTASAEVHVSPELYAPHRIRVFRVLLPFRVRARIHSTTRRREKTMTALISENSRLSHRARPMPCWRAIPAAAWPLTRSADGQASASNSSTAAKRPNAGRACLRAAIVPASAYGDVPGQFGNPNSTHAELTTQQAGRFAQRLAALPGQLLDEGKIPLRTVGKYRRVRFDEPDGLQAER